MHFSIMGLKNFLSGLSNTNGKETTLDGLLREWIKKLENYSQPGKDITALNFGLFESDKRFMIYLTGSRSYDSSNDDWASEVDYEPISLYKYLLLSTNDVVKLKWDGVSQAINSVLKNIIAENPSYKLFKNRVVTAGFDEGDLIIIKD